MPARHRRRRERAIQAPAPVSSGPTLMRRPITPVREWHWRTFPVFFTFAATLFCTALLAEVVSGSASVTLLVVPGALAFAAALSHLVSVRFLAPRAKPPRGGPAPQ